MNSPGVYSGNLNGLRFGNAPWFLSGNRPGVPHANTTAVFSKKSSIFFFS